MIKVVNDLLAVTDSGKQCILLSLDISAAFDLLDHFCLLQRATELFGLDDNVINWLKSYLNGRISYVCFRNCRSSSVGCNTGVPQSSVSGSLLFSIFTSPVGQLISSFNISYHQYADDTQLYTSVDPSSSTHITRLSSCAEAFTKWHLENYLLLNPSKTEVRCWVQALVHKLPSSTMQLQIPMLFSSLALVSVACTMFAFSALPLINSLLLTMMWLT
jgi:hypothetical protein